MSKISKEELELLCGMYKQPKTVLEFAVHNAAEELKRFRDLEEQGRLIKVKQGRWLPNAIMIKSPYANNYHCSECGQIGNKTPYCPNCGAELAK